MNGIAIIGCTIGGALAGGTIGAWYGFAVDKSDIPLFAMFTAPAGALIGGLAGVIAGSVIFA